MWLSWLGMVLQSERLPVQFPIRACGWVGDSVFGPSMCYQLMFLSHTNVSLPLFLLPPSPSLKIIKSINKILKQERENGLDLENIFLYMFFACLQHLVAVGLHQLLESRKFWKPIEKVEMSTSNQKDVDMSWTPHETFNQINKASGRT